MIVTRDERATEQPATFDARAGINALVIRPGGFCDKSVSHVLACDIAVKSGTFGTYLNTYPECTQKRWSSYRFRRIVVHVTQTMHRSDHDLLATVSDELLYTPSINTNLAVTVNDGMVTLAGDVGSLPERLAAKQAAERVWGVKVVADKMVVRSAGASGATDTDLAGVASDMLAWSIDVPSTVTVEIRDRVLTLSGAVTWDFQREAAKRAVSYIRGISGVDSNISLSQSASVSVMKDAVEAAIGRNALLVAHAITVEVNGHELTLHGSVRSSAERQQAEHVAWAAAGVASVKNNLVIMS